MAMFEKWWEDTTGDTMLRDVRRNRERTWENLEGFISAAPSGSGLAEWARKNGVTREEAERMMLLAQKLKAVGARLSDLMA